MTEYNKLLEEILQQFATTPEAGLEENEAAERLIRQGANVVRESKKKSLFQRFLEQFKDAMIIILLIAAGISFFIASFEGEGFYEPVLILLIVLLNAALGLIQESKAEKALEALKKLSAPRARVRRAGREEIIDAAGLVPGDIIIVEAGDYVPADARLIEAANLRTEESSLTGESAPVDKNAGAEISDKASIGDRKNMIYSGTAVAYGRGLAVVTATGMQTEMGRIADLLESETDGMTPLQIKLAALGKYLGIAALLACAIIFVIGLLEGMPALDIFMVSVALAVSAIPEGLPAIVTVILAIGVQRMVKRRAIIRRLPAVETLGSASVICSDKTGTLTENRMTLTDLYLADLQQYEKVYNRNSGSARKLLRLAAMCSDGNIAIEQGQEKHIGDPTETAIILAAHRNGIIKEDLSRLYPRLAELSFDSDRKLMTTVNQVDDQIMVIVKGAFDVLANKCVAGEITGGYEANEEMGKKALRVLAIGYKTINSVPANPTPDNLETDLTFLGLVGMIDPPRPEAKTAVATCRQAGIKPVMITGDHILTASAIATELGILQAGDRAITNLELEEMSDHKLNLSVEEIVVYARVSPADKIRIVRAWQNCGAVVAMTGDGVNDAPALKAADIGCAMGITGTDVAKGAADITLTDDNFATIVEAVREGRGIYDNIRKVVGFLLGTNIGELLTVLLAMLIWKVTPLLSMQLLWINLVTDSFPAIALGMEPVEKEAMQRKPRPKNESIFAGGYGTQIILQGVMFALLTLVGFQIGINRGSDPVTGRTMAFIVLALSQIFHSFNMRSVYSIFTIGPFSNRALCLATLTSTILVGLVIFIPPFAFAFGLTALAPDMYLIALLLALVPIPVLETAKAAGLIRKIELS